MPVDFVVCDNDPCKCAPASDPDECCCILAAGAALIDGAPCAKCGAPLDVVMAPEAAAAQIIRERLFAVSFSAELQPGEERAITVEMASTFRPERLTFARPLQTKWQRVAAWTLHLLKFPALIRWSFVRASVLLQEFRDRPSDAWNDPDEPPRRWGRELRELLGNIWRAPWPGPPVELVNIHVGAAAQMASTGPVPSEIFSSLESPALMLDTARPGDVLSVTVRSTSREPYKVRGAFTGRALVGPPPAPIDPELLRLLRAAGMPDESKG